MIQKYFYLRNNKNIIGTEISLIDGSKNIFEFQVFDTQNITFHDENFPMDDYLSQPSAIALNIVGFNFEYVNKYLYWDDFDVKIHIFHNVGIIILNEEFNVRYLLSENNEFSVITDKNFIIIGFVIHAITPMIIKILKDYALKLKNNKKSLFPF